MSAMIRTDGLGATSGSSAPTEPIASRPTRVVSEASIAREIEACEELCRAALALDVFLSIARLPLIPRGPRACFDLMLGIPDDPRRMEVARRLKRTAAELERETPFAFERLLTLQAYLEALPRLRDTPAPDSLKQQFCVTCQEVASAPLRPDARLELGSDAFEELAKIATLRRFHAGQCSFDVLPRMPLAWLLKAHPVDLPGFLWELFVGMRGLGPVVVPHINYWRANKLFLTKREHERAIFRMAQYVEQCPAIRGLVTSSWLYAFETRESSRTSAGCAIFMLTKMRRSWTPGRRSPTQASSSEMNGAKRYSLRAPSTPGRRSSSGLAPICWLGRIATRNMPPTLAAPCGRRVAPKRREASSARRWRSGRWTLMNCRRALIIARAHILRWRSRCRRRLAPAPPPQFGQPRPPRRFFCTGRLFLGASVFVSPMKRIVLRWPLNQSASCGSSR